MAAMINPLVAALQLPEGFTVRKVRGGALKVVAAKPRKAAVVIVSENKNWDDWAEVLVASQKEKEMLRAVRAVAKGYGFDWQGSLIKTLVANEKAVFTAQEMYDALQSVSQGEDMDRLSDVERVLGMMAGRAPSPVRLEKVDNTTYKVKYIDRTWSECR